MSGQSPIVVLDASAVLAWVLNDPGWKAVDRLLPVATIPASAMVECLYAAKAKGQRTEPEELYAALRAVGLRVEPVTAEDVVRAAELIAASHANAEVNAEKRSPSLSLGDGLCIAVAERLELPLAGGDTYWETLDLRVSFMPFR